MNFYEEVLLPKITRTVDAEMELPYFKELLAGTLSMDVFRFQMKQDYNYLVEYSRAWCAGLAKCQDFDMLTIWMKVVNSLLEVEIPEVRNHHIEALGIPAEELDGTMLACLKRAYTSHEVARSWEGDLAEHVCALLPCYFVYWHMSLRLDTLCTLPDDHLFKQWYKVYTDGAMADTCELLIRIINKLTENKTPREIARLEEIFAVGCNYEYMSWRDMYYKQEFWPLPELFPEKKFNMVEKFVID